jgi:hypothetical protein
MTPESVIIPAGMFVYLVLDEIVERRKKAGGDL